MRQDYLTNLNVAANFIEKLNDEGLKKPVRLVHQVIRSLLLLYRSLEYTRMTWSIAMHSCFGRTLGGKSLPYVALLLAVALFTDCLKMSSAPDASSTLWSREGFGFKNCG